MRRRSDSKTSSPLIEENTASQTEANPDNQEAKVTDHSELKSISDIMDIADFGTNNHAKIGHFPGCTHGKKGCSCQKVAHPQHNKSRTQKSSKKGEKSVKNSGKQTAGTKRPIKKKHPSRTRNVSLHILDTTMNNTDTRPSSSKALGLKIKEEAFEPPAAKKRLIETGYSAQQWGDSILPWWLQSVLNGVSKMSKYLVRSHMRSSEYSLQYSDIAKLETEMNAVKPSYSRDLFVSESITRKCSEQPVDLPASSEGILANKRVNKHPLSVSQTSTHISSDNSPPSPAQHMNSNQEPVRRFRFIPLHRIYPKQTTTSPTKEPTSETPVVQESRPSLHFGDYI